MVPFRREGKRVRVGGWATTLEKCVAVGRAARAAPRRGARALGAAGGAGRGEDLRRRQTQRGPLSRPFPSLPPTPSSDRRDIFNQHRVILIHSRSCSRSVTSFLLLKKCLLRKSYPTPGSPPPSRLHRARPNPPPLGTSSSPAVDGGDDVTATGSRAGLGELGLGTPPSDSPTCGSPTAALARPRAQGT